MDQWILEIMNSYGYLGMALLILGENLFPPIPSEVILTFGGFMTSYTQMHIPKQSSPQLQEAWQELSSYIRSEVF